MTPFIFHALMMLRDMNMSIEDPEIYYATISDNDNARIHHNIVDRVSGVYIEQNQQMKFMMMFTILDVYIDNKYPLLEGKAFVQKYKDLPYSNDAERMFRELFRIAKVIRNCLVHNPSSFAIANDALKVNYLHRNTNFDIEISLQSLQSFYTALVMYFEGHLGNGNYFLGIMRFLYANILFGVSSFSDEFGNQLAPVPSGLQIRSDRRMIVVDTQYKENKENIKINFDMKYTHQYQGVDFSIEYKGNKILLPLEALTPEFTISKLDLLNNWKYEGTFPPLSSVS